ncbi:MAG: WG repeat-containing protein [Oscillospiraceae bacterium]|nr:WG repeat-containing protein [Oscillospiraceae bacterium]
MKSYHYYPVEVKRPRNTPKPKARQLSQFHLKLIVIIGLALAVTGPPAFYAANFMLVPVKILLEPSLEYDFLSPIDEGLFIAEISGKYGIINKAGEVVAPAVYDEIGYYIEDRNPFYVKNGFIRVVKDYKHGLIDTSGKIIFPLIYDYIGEFHEEMARIGLEGKWGYIDINGNFAIDLIYDGAFDFSEGLAMVKRGDHYFGFIDKTGEIVIPFIYNGISYDAEFKNGLIVMRIFEDGYGVIDKTGNIVIPFEYSGIQYNHYADEIYFQAGKFDEVNQSARRTSFFDEYGEIMLEINDGEYDDIGHLSGGLLAVKKDEKWGYINKAGEIVAPFIYIYTGYFNQGLAVVGLGGKNPRPGNFKIKYGMIDTSGKEVVPCEYDGIFNYDDFTVGEAILVMKSIPDPGGKTVQKYGYINKTGDEIISPIYDDPIRFEYGLAQVNKGGKQGVINPKGDIVTELIYEDIAIVNERLIFARKNGKWGLLNTKGDIVLDYDYEQITKRRNGKLLGIKKDGLWGILEIK